jgi:protein involved in polysaccharide export with SLBB domain
MKQLITSTLFIFILTSVISLAQTEQQIQQKLQQEGITSMSDVQAELKKRNMTEDDARKLAKQYGMDYDQFIKTYILGGKAIEPPTTTGATTVQTTVVTEEKPKEIETTPPPPPTPKTEGGMEYFGYKIFESIPTAFEPTAVGPIDPGYLIGPGDVLRLYLWGSVELQHQLEVDAQGTIFIPTAGQYFVSGVSYKDLQVKMTRYLSKFYEGLASEPPTIFLDISIAKLKPIKIFVLGEVPRPGGYNISSFATVFNALYAVGGPLTSGSLREIRVIRNNKVLTTVDLYDYLLKGQLIGDVRLQNNDMIFIPPRGKTVTIKGEILRPAIYELKPGENLKKLIDYSGRLKTTAYLGRAQVERVLPFEQRKKFELERQFLDLDLSKIIGIKDEEFQLYDNDVVTIFPVLDRVENFVKVEGAVYRSGTYELSKVQNIKELISEAYGVLPEVYYGKADIIRTRPDETYEFISFNLGLALQGDPLNNINLKPRDQVKIYSIYELVDRKSVSISGYVKSPVTLPYADSLTLYDMVFRAGGLQDPIFRGRAFMMRGDLIRINPDGLTTRIIPFDLEKLLNDQSFNMQLNPGDKIYIYTAEVEKVLDKSVSVEGDVRSPGQFNLNSNMTVIDAILQAGGFTESSLRTEVYVNRLRPGGYPGDKLSEIYTVKLPVNFEKKQGNTDNSIDTLDTKTDFKLQHKDVVIVRKNPNYEPQRRVTIRGEVKYPGTYVLENRKEKLLGLIKKAYGPTSEAFLFGSLFSRGDQRLVVDLEKLYDDEDEDYDVQLLEGDDVFIPKVPNTVLVTGEVNNPGLFKFLEGDNVKDYIDRAGGETDSADYIIYRKANGESKKVGFGLFSSNPEALDGSIIHVKRVPPPPPEGEKFDIAGTIKDVFAIAASAATLIYLVSQVKK